MMSARVRPFTFSVSQTVQALASLHRPRAYARLLVPVLLNVGVLMAQMTFAGSSVTNDGAVESTTRKALFVNVDGIPVDAIERVLTPGIEAVVVDGSYQRASAGGELGMPTESPTVSAFGYMSLITGTWSNNHKGRANYGIEPRYAFWDILRVAKHQTKTVTTGFFSMWTDNRTVPVGVGLDKAGGYKVDFVAEGLEKDPAFASPLDDLDRIQAIDLHVTTVAPTTIVETGPDLPWVYLQHTDDIGHRDGDGSSMDLAVRWMGARIAELWSAVQARKKEAANEDWLVLITTDHGRISSDGRGHGGQSDMERTICIASNSLRIVPNRERTPAIVDINPTIEEHLRFALPAEFAAQLEGQSLLSKSGAEGVRGI